MSEQRSEYNYLKSESALDKERLAEMKATIEQLSRRKQEVIRETI